ncbi:MAG TPA: hypothetical protein PKA53_01820 [Sphingobacterium sp.]|nr:hypothetical protein [Sphingobacterium sp.]
MKRLMSIMFVAISFVLSCEESESRLQAVDKADLAELLKEIKGQIDTAVCTDPETWSFTALGSKACGGPQMYIAYPHTIDTVVFLALAKQYTHAEQAYNKKHGIVSNCMMVMPPEGIVCEGEKPVLVYSYMK